MTKNKEATTKIYHSKAPCRIDLSGGTLDLWPLYLFYQGGLSLNHMALGLYAETEIRKQEKKDFLLTVHSEDLGVTRSFRSLSAIQKSLRQDTQENPLRWILRVCVWCLEEWNLNQGSWEVICRSEVPSGSGLGGSSTLGVSILGAWAKAAQKEELLRADPWKFQGILRDLESVEIEKPAGEQDYVPALFGGLLTLKLDVGKKGVLRHPKSVGQKIASQLALIYTGKPHHSGINNWSVFKKYLEGDGKILTALDGIQKVSHEMTRDFFRQDSLKWKKLIGEEWRHRQNLGPAVNVPVLKKASRWIESRGALATKACGAGGGGCLLVVFKNEKQKQVLMAQSLPDKRWRWLPVTCAEEGVLGAGI